MSDEEKKIKPTSTKQGEAEARKLTPKEELFCQFYAGDRDFFGNGVQSYIEAYAIDITQKGAYNTARVSAHNLLTKPNIIKRINDILEDGVLNDIFVDKQLAFTISQHGDLRAKVSGIKEYNALKKRVDQKTDFGTQTLEALEGLTKAILNDKKV